MSPAFYIRNLHEERGDCLNLDPSDYDHLIVQNHPDARLMYLDEDDGEMITIGSGLELSQRLEGPALPLSRYAYKDKDLEDNPMHIFDIQPTRGVRLVWKRIKSDSSKAQAPQGAVQKAEGQSSERGGSIGKNTSTLSLLEGNARRYLSRDVPQTTAADAKARDRWFQACQPPGIPHDSVSETSYNMAALADRSEKQQTQVWSTSRSPVLTLTPEGQRKAKEAGEKLGRHVQWPKINPGIPVDSTKENRWASYQTNVQTASPFTWKSQKPQSFVATDPPNVQISDAEAKGKSRDNQSRPGLDIGRNVDNSTAEDNEISTPLSAEPTIQAAGETVVKAVQTLAVGMGLLGAALSERLPELEERISTVQQSVPDHVGSVVSQAVEGMQNHAESLARTIQLASDASLEAAERTRQADATLVEDFLAGFGGFIVDLGKALFTPVDNFPSQEITTNSQDYASVDSSVKENIANTSTASEKKDRSSFLEEALENKRSAVPKSSKSKEQDVTDKTLRPSVTFAELGTSRDALDKSRPLRHPSSMANISIGQSQNIYGALPRPSSEHVVQRRSVCMSRGSELTKQQANRYRRLNHMQSTPVLARNTKPILDLEDLDFEFSARYPSLLSSNEVRRSNTIANPTSHSDYLRTMNPEAEIARFPTVSELEQVAAHQTHSDGNKERSGTVSKSNATSTSLQYDPGLLQRVPGAWPQAPSDVETVTKQSFHGARNESSGAFFERMTGRRASRLEESALEGKEQDGPMPRRAHTTGGSGKSLGHTHHFPRQRDSNDQSSNEKTEPQNPLNADFPCQRPISLRGQALLEYQEQLRLLEHHKERQAVAAQSTTSKTLWSQSNFSVPDLATSNTKHQASRRPYSVHYTGSGRNGPMNTFIQSSPPPAPAPRPSRLTRPKSMYKNLASTTREPAKTTTMFPVQAEAIAKYQASDAPSQPPSKIDSCTRHLKNLGYASTAAFSDDRLRMIATMTNGDVADAIEIIEEERKAWERRGW